MATFFNHHLFTLCLFLLSFISTTTPASAMPMFYPKTLLLTVSKDSTTSQYTTTLLQRTPPVPVSLTLDLGNPFLWVVCGSCYTSTTYHPVPCGCRQCKLADANICRTCPAYPKPGCNKNTCRTLSITNPLTHTSPPRGSELATDVVRINSTDGSTTGQLVTIPNFLFVCAPVSLLHGLATGVSGVAGLGRSKFSLASPIFALCLPPFSESGPVFLGDGPYNISPGGTGTVVDLRSTLSYTPLISNPVFTSEYFIQVQAIKVAGKLVPINKSLLSINSKGHGGTTISLVHPYTTLETSLFKAVTTIFDQQMEEFGLPAKRVDPVEPFEFCYDPTTIQFTRIGPVVPDIDLVLQNEKVVWRIAPTNSFVRASSNAYCLGFVDGGKNPRTSIVIGGYQIEDNLLQFDLAKNRLGFSSSLIYDRIRCSFFNFSNNALSVNM